MSSDEEEYIKKKLKKLKEKFPGASTEQIERELFPHIGEEVVPKVLKKKKKE